MNAEEFVYAIDDADFDILLTERLYEFLEFVREETDEGEDSVVLRCSMEGEEQGSKFPYYVWLVYKVLIDGDNLGLAAKEFYIPSEGELTSYYESPQNLRDRNFFAFVLE